MVVPTPDGILNPLVLAAAQLAGVDEIYRVGGAQAVAALAYGTATIAPPRQDRRPRQCLGRSGQAPGVRAGRHRHDCRSIRGADPGRWRGQPGLDRRRPPWPRPSTTPPPRPCSSPTAPISRMPWRQPWSGRSPPSPAPRSPGRAGAITERSCARARLRRGDPPRGQNRPRAPRNRDEGRGGAVPKGPQRGRNIFLGSHTPEAIGDYVGGPNHVLPTARSARFSSGLGVLDFMKRTTVLACTPESLRALGPAAITLGRSEGLEGHARSVAIRLNL